MRGLLLLPLLLLGTPAAAQHADHAGHGAHDQAAPGHPAPAPDPHAGHHAGHGAPAEPEPATEPPPPAGHAADRLFDPQAMAAARRQLRVEHGDHDWYSAGLDIAELQLRGGQAGYRWDGEGWYGSDLERAVLRSQGEGGFGGGVEEAEVQALYWRALDPYVDLQAGMRGDFRPEPQRAYATVGLTALLPYWIELEGSLFLSHRGDALARLEFVHDLQITQSVVLQSRAELNMAFQDVPALDTGAGLSDAELGVRLRYEIKPEIAPYIGVSHSRKVGHTARLARAAGEDTASTSLVLGIRTWF